MTTATILVDRDADPETAVFIVTGLQGMAAKESAHAAYVAACLDYQAAEDAANVADASAEVLEAWRAAEARVDAARAAWFAI